MLPTQEDKMLQLFVCESDIQRLHTALISYAATLEPDKSEAAIRERGFLISLANDITTQN
jgi:hypothetical protein